MEYWSHGGTKNFRLGPSFNGKLVPRTNFFGDQFSSDSTVEIADLPNDDDQDQDPRF